jgi:hypothetical protein
MKTPMNINERDLQSDWIDAILYDFNAMHDSPVLSAEWTYNTNTVCFTSMGKSRVRIMQDLHNELLQIFESCDTIQTEITKVNDYTLIIRFYYNDVL